MWITIGCVYVQSQNRALAAASCRLRMLVLVLFKACGHMFAAIHIYVYILINQVRSSAHIKYVLRTGENLIGVDGGDAGNPQCIRMILR